MAGAQRLTCHVAPGQLAAVLGTEARIIEWLRLECEASLAAVHARSAGAAADHPSLVEYEDYVALRLALIDHKRSTVVRLRDERTIDDTVLRRLQAALDNEEVRLSGSGTTH